MQTSKYICMYICIQILGVFNVTEKVLMCSYCNWLQTLLHHIRIKCKTLHVFKTCFTALIVSSHTHTHAHAQTYSVLHWLDKMFSLFSAVFICFGKPSPVRIKVVGWIEVLKRVCSPIWFFFLNLSEVKVSSLI